MPFKDKQKEKEYAKQYRLNNKEKIKQYRLDNKEKMKQYRLDNEEKIKESIRQWRLDNKEKEKEKKRQWRLDNKENIKQYRLDNKEKIKESKRRWCLNNKEKIKQWRLDNRDYFNKYNKNRFKTDPIFKLIKTQRGRMWAVLKGKRKYKSTIKLLGCSIEECWNHLEQQFKPGMTRDNYGLWHVDHIIPCASFDFNDPEQQKKCFHYTNLQPLWAEDNLKKGAKLDYETQY
jgi:hypothetical protein